MKKKDSPFFALEKMREALPSKGVVAKAPAPKVAVDEPASFASWMQSGEVAQTPRAPEGPIRFDYVTDRSSAVRAGEPEHRDALRRAPIDARLELHGMTRDAAELAVREFVVAARKRRERCVLLVHGKGTGSVGGVPVLRHEMAAWLTLSELASCVLAYAPAKPHEGGEGATVVLLTRG